MRRIATFGITVLLFASVMLSLVLPLSEFMGAGEEEYSCVWEDGTVTVETYASVYPDFVESSEVSVMLFREGLFGEIALSAQFSGMLRTLRTGGLAELLSLGRVPLTRLEKLVLWRTARGTVWYSGGYFVWSERGLRRIGFAIGEKLVLLSGTISAARLGNTGAKVLELRAEAELSAKSLVGTAVEKVTAYAPYTFENGAVYLDTGTATRLIAAVPACVSLELANYDYADEGALLACRRLEELTLPFAGNAPSGIGNYFCGEFAYLFSDGAEFLVPSSLKRVNISDGVLVSHAFYYCPGIEEINLCGMSSENIQCDAFLDCTGLKRLHTPSSEVSLCGNFVSHIAPCGCTVFQRIV